MLTVDPTARAKPPRRRAGPPIIAPITANRAVLACRIVTRDRTLRGRQLFLLVSAATGCVAVVAFLTTSRRVRAAMDKARQPFTGEGDILLVFGASATVSGPSNELRARLDHARALHRSGVAPVIAVSGGESAGIDEVVVMSDYLVASGCPPDAVIPLRPGDNTRLTLQAAADAQLQGERIIAVSSPTHAHRISAEARRRGLAVQVSCPIETPEFNNPDVLRARLLTEIIASLAYAGPPRIARVSLNLLGRARHTVPLALASLSSRLRKRRR